MRILYVISKTLIVVLSLGLSLAQAANDSPQTFTLDGQLYAGDRMSPLLDAAAKIKVQILDPSKNCILYEEEQPVDTTSSAGHFSIQVGSVVGSIKRKALDAGNTMQKVYQNTSVISATGVSCSGLYSPVLGAIRYVRVIVTPTAGSPNTLSPDMVLDAVPNAMVAQSVQGLERENILQSNPAASLTQTKLEQFFMSLTSGAGSAVKFDGTNFVAYDPNNASSLTPGTVSDAAIGSVGWSKVTSVPPAIAAVAGLSCANGKILKMVSGSWACSDESGVGVESDPTVAAFAKSAPGAGLTVSGGAIVADFGAAAGKIAQGNDSRFTDSRAPNGAASGDLSGTYPSPTVAKLQGHGVSVTSPADGQVLRYDNSSSTWNPVNFGIDDLKTSIGTSQFVSASCLASQTLIWSAVTDTFSCTTIAITGSQVSGDIAGNAANVTGTIAIAHGGTGAITAVAALNALLPAQSGANGKVLQSDGTNASWQTPAAGGITSFNGSSQASQSLSTPGVTGTAPNWSTNTGTGAHTLNIPMANTASVTAGLISKTDYDNFNSKLSSESDPKVGANTTSSLSKWNGSALVASGVFESSGNVGIGTASPGFPLDVVGVIGSRQPTVSVGGATKINMYAGTTSTENTAMIAGVKGEITQVSPLKGDLVFRVNAGDSAGEVARVTSAGNMGIGITTPTAKLDVNGTVNATAFTVNGVPFTGGSDNLGNHTATQDLNLGAFKLVGNGGTSGINIDSSGNVGVGSAAPVAKLEVAGNIKVGNSSSTCDASTEGVQRYNSTSKQMEFCDGTSWKNMRPSLGAIVSRSDDTSYLAATDGFVMTYTGGSNYSDDTCYICTNSTNSFAADDCGSATQLARAGDGKSAAMASIKKGMYWRVAFDDGGTSGGSCATRWVPLD